MCLISNNSLQTVALTFVMDSHFVLPKTARLHVRITLAGTETERKLLLFVGEDEAIALSTAGVISLL